MSRYEHAFAELVGTRHAVAFCYARTALQAVLRALGLRPGDEVLLAPLTCKVVPLAILSLGLRPAYADVSEDTLNLDPVGASRAAGAHTRAVVFQHTYGSPGGSDAVAEVAARLGVPLIEDCAQCLPHRIAGRLPGGLGIAAVFSNNLGKPLPAGSGGVAVTGDSQLAGRLRELRDDLPTSWAGADLRLRAERWLHTRILRPETYWALYGLYRTVSPAYRVRPLAAELAGEVTGAARRPSRYQLRLGEAALVGVRTNAEHRRAACEDYLRGLRDAPEVRLPAAAAAEPLYYFPVLVERKRQLLREARRRRLELVPWPVSTPIYPVEDAAALSAYGYARESCPVAEAVAGKLVGLPTRGGVTADHRRRIMDLVRAVGA